MSWNPYPPLPVGPLKDLLGITRALYRLTVTEDPKDVVRLQALTDVGKTLRWALSKATAPPGTIEHQEAWAAAERATKALGELVGARPGEAGQGQLERLVSATAQCVVGVRKPMAHY